MQTIYKYPLTDAPRQLIVMPKNAKIISLQLQHGIPTIWALVETANKPVYRSFEILTTGTESGHPIYGQYIGTLQFEGGDFVLHYFDRGQKAHEGEVAAPPLHAWFSGE